jgi:hypothetical protein
MKKFSCIVHDSSVTKEVISVSLNLMQYKQPINVSGDCPNRQNQKSCLTPGATLKTLRTNPGWV